MNIAHGGRYKTHGMPEALANLSDVALISLHVGDKEERKLVLAGIKKAGLQRDDHNKLADPVMAAAAAATAIASKVTVGCLSLRSGTYIDVIDLETSHA